MSNLITGWVKVPASEFGGTPAKLNKAATETWTAWKAAEAKLTAAISPTILAGEYTDKDGKAIDIPDGATVVVSRKAGDGSLAFAIAAPAAGAVKKTAKKATGKRFK